MFYVSTKSYLFNRIFPLYGKFFIFSKVLFSSFLSEHIIFFSNYIGDSRGISVLRGLLLDIMIRRTKNAKDSSGKHIVDLPKKTQVNKKVILFYFIFSTDLFYLILSYLILFFLILFYLILFYLILFYLILSYLILSYFILFYFILSYFILSYFIPSHYFPSLSSPLRVFHQFSPLSSLYEFFLKYFFSTTTSI